MSSCAVSCEICLQNFSNDQELHSTECGHIFHSRCIRDWIMRTPNCPNCRSHVNQTHIIYLNLSDTCANESETNELEEQIDDYLNCISSLQCEIDKTVELEENLSQSVLNHSALEFELTNKLDETSLNAAITISKAECETEQKLYQFRNETETLLNERNVLVLEQEKKIKQIEAELKIVHEHKIKLENNLTKSFASTANRESSLQLQADEQFKTFDELTIALARKSDECKQLQLQVAEDMEKNTANEKEIENLNKRLNSIEFTNSFETAFNYPEKKINDLKLKLEKIVAESVNLRNENLKLKNSLDSRVSVCKQCNALIQNTLMTEPNEAASLPMIPLKDVTDFQNPATSESVVKTSSNVSEASNGVIIKLFVNKYEKFDLKIPILDMAQEMQAKITTFDIKAIKVLNSNKKKCNEQSTLLVKFQSPTLQDEFMRAKDKLKQSLKYRHVLIYNYTVRVENSNVENSNVENSNVENSNLENSNVERESHSANDWTNYGAYDQDLYQYATRLLKEIRYYCVFKKKNRIYAKKRKILQAFEIISKQQVDGLVREYYDSISADKEKTVLHLPDTQ